MLREAAQEKLDFVHNTLKEFLSAEQFVDNQDVGLLVNQASDASWWPIINFAASSTNGNFVTTLIERLLDETERAQNKGVQRAGRLLAVRCASSALELDSTLRARVDAIARRLFPPKNMSEAESLAFGGDDVVQELEYKERRKAREAAACVRTLGIIGTPRAMSALREYFQDVRSTVVNEVIQHANPLRAALIIKQLVEGEYLGEEVLRRVSTLEPLRGAGRIEALSLPYVRVPSLEPLNDVVGLQTLRLFRASIESWSGLAGLSSLRHLDVNGSNILDGSLEFLPKGIDRLELAGTAITNFEHLSRIEALRSLNIFSTQISSLGGAEKLENLKELRVGGRELTSIEALGERRELEVLHIHDAPSLRSLATLSSFEKLIELSLVRVDENDLLPVMNCRSLKKLIILSKGAARLALEGVFRHLESCYLSAGEITSLAGLSQSPFLEELGLVGWSQPTMDTLGSVSRVKTLDISSGVIESLEGIQNLKGLETLRVSIPPETDCSTIVNCTKLRRIDIAYGADNKSLREAAAKMANVKVDSRFWSTGVPRWRATRFPMAKY